MTAPEAVEQVLRHLTLQARNADTDDPFCDLVAVPILPLEALSKIGTLTRLDPAVQGDSLPSLLAEDASGQAQIEISPFGPLALISSDGAMNTDPIAHALADAAITPLFPGDLDQAGKWHGVPLSKWLFPQRLSDAFALIKMLR